MVQLRYLFTILKVNFSKCTLFFQNYFIIFAISQHTFGSPKKHLSSWLDGFAKLHSFKFDGSNVYFSGKMVESTTYMDSVAAGELVPQVTLNKLANPDEEWTALEIGDILYRQMTQWYGDLSSNAVSIFTSDICNISLEKNSKFVFFLHF